MKVLISGGSGLIGIKLVEKLIENNHEVNILTRSKSGKSLANEFEWDYKRNYIEKGALEGVNAIVHLAGAGIADERWTPKRKIEIIESRVKTLDCISRNIGNKTIEIFIGGSAIGYYGADTGDTLNTIKSKPGSDFLAECTKKWEKAEVDFASKHNALLSIVRTGVVLSNDGGALPKLVTPIKYNAGAAIGSGNQWISWIHIEDIVDIFFNSILDKNSPNIINGVADIPVTNLEFNKIASKILDKKFFLPNIPSFILKMALGEMAAVVLGSNKVIKNQELNLKYNTLDDALKNLLIN